MKGEVAPVQALIKGTLGQSMDGVDPNLDESMTVATVLKDAPLSGAV